MTEPTELETLRILYRNHRGETRWRVIVPSFLWFASTKWHPEEQWLLEAMDIEKGERRLFALRDILSFGEPSCHELCSAISVLSGWSWHGPDGKPRIAVDADELNRLKTMAAGWEKKGKENAKP